MNRVITMIIAMIIAGAFGYFYAQTLPALAGVPLGFATGYLIGWIRVQLHDIFEMEIPSDLGLTAEDGA